MELTFGEKRIRTEFNPLNDSTVDKIKQMTAMIIDTLEGVKNDEVSKTYQGTSEDLKQVSGEKLRLIALAQTAYEEAVLWAVKSVTC